VQEGEAAPPADIREYDLLEGMRRQKPAWNLGAQARQVKCTECGAEVEFPDGVTATKCSFCDSPSVLAQEARRDLIQPESLVPFAVSREQSAAAFKQWISRLWFRPSDLRHKASISDLRGVYVPYWTYDCEVDSAWNADAGYYYYTTETYTAREGNRTVTRTRQVRRIRWEPASGRRHDSYDDHLVCASRGLPDDLARGMANFQTGALVAYAPQYLQGFSAESYAVDLKGGWDRAREEIARSQLSRCSGDVPGDTQRNLRASHRFSDATFKHVLLPVWVAAFRYHDKVFRFLVNGQTGKVSGKAPWSWLKITLFALVCAAALAVVIYLFAKNRG
jgi:hypothetical protein